MFPERQGFREKYRSIARMIFFRNHILSFIDSVSPYTEVINFEYNETNVFSEDLFFDGFHLDVYSGLPLFTQMLFDR